MFENMTTCHHQNRFAKYATSKMEVEYLDFYTSHTDLHGWLFAKGKIEIKPLRNVYIYRIYILGFG